MFAVFNPVEFAKDVLPMFFKVCSDPAGHASVQEG